MSLSALATEFRQQAASNNGNITVNAASFATANLTPPSGLDALLQKGYQLADGTNLLINTSTGSIPDPVGNVLTITGQAGVLNVSAANTAVSFVIIDDGSGNIQFTILITLSQWSFSTSWELMSGGVFDSLPYSSPAFVFSTNDVAQYSWQRNNITLTAGQNFTCLITLTGILQQVVNFLTSWNGSTNLALAGMLDPSKVNNEDVIYPDMDLKVMIPVQAISLLFLTVSDPAIGFKVETVVETGTEEPPADEIASGEAVVAATDEKQVVQTPSLYFELQLHLGADIQMDFTAAIIPFDKTFDIAVTSDPQKPLTPLKLFSLMAGNNWFLILPPTLQQFLNTIAFKSFATSVDFNNGLSINSVSAQVGSVGAWQLFENFTIKEFDVQWVVIAPGTINNQTIYLTATADFFPTIFQGGFEVEITSNLTLSASFAGSVTFNNLMAAITGGAIDIPDNLLLIEFTGFGINMDINNKYYEFYATTNIDLNFITNISVTDGSLRLTSSSPVSGSGPSVYTAQVTGLFTIGQLQLNVTVNYNSSNGWDLSLAMPAGNSLNLGELMKGLFQAINLPTSFLPDSLSITQFSLDATIPTGTAKSSYEVKAGLQWIFTFPIIDQKINIIANLRLKYEAATNDGANGKYSGGVAGSVILDYFNAQVDISYNFADNNQNLSITWEGFTATYDVSGESRTIVFSIKNWTLGGLITSFMKMLFNPTFELDAPWDILNKVSLDGFSVTYNLDTKDIKVTYKLPKSLNLIFINITGINLTKNAKGVFITFDGNSVVPSVNDSNLFKPATGGQDVQKMPDVPGQGNQYFDLRLLAMGQHVELANPAQYNSIKDVTAAMQAAFTEPEPGTIPIGPGSGNSLLKFNEDSNWLIATNFGILNAGTKDKPVWTLDMQVVFNDPNLYGLRIAMAGGKAKIFAGLEFEIMYKKISDSIGVYQIDLTLPNALRYLQFGAVNITLPSIALEIYTNGDFMVDIGFPHNMDFSRSFTLQAIVPPGIPAMGSGGFYFGKLSSATTNKVPKTNYGNFNPVIVFGIGLQVGVGYSVNYGILSAGFSVTMFGIIEGVIAAYYPYSGTLQESNKEQVETSYYYYLQGTIGIIGKLYGSIDFGIISASVNITVMVYAQATFEAYKKIPLAIVASVDVRVSAKLNLGIFSITIHFTFTAKIKFDLTIGTDQTAKAPWNNNLGAPTPSARRAVPAAATLLTTSAKQATSPEPVSLGASADVSTALEGVTLPELLVVRRSPAVPMHYRSTLLAEPTDSLPTLNLYFVPSLTVAGPENGNLKTQTAQYVATLFIDAPDPAGDGSSTTSFEYLCADFFRWLVLNYIDHTPSASARATVDSQGISKADLDALVAFLSNENNPFPIPTSQLLSFLQNSFEAVNVQLMKSNLPAAAIFPMFFDLELKVPGTTPPLDIQFNDYNMATQEYLSAVKEWFAELAVKVQQENPPTAKRTAAAITEDWSMSTFVFEDYFVMIGKQLAGYASDAMDNFTYRLSNGNSLAAMVNWANSITVDGHTNHANIQDVATVNQSHPLTGGNPLAITGVMYNIAEGDTFTSIAVQYPLTPTMLIVQNGNVPGLLAPQTVTYKGNSYNVQATDTINAVAVGVKTTLNELAADAVFEDTAVLTTGAWLIIGAALYTAKSEDTFTAISTTVYPNLNVSALLLQNQITPGLFIAGNSFDYNGTKYTIVPGDTLTSIAIALSTPTTTVTVQDLANNAQVQAQQVQPLGQVLVQPFIHTTATFTDAAQADTLDALSQKYNTTAALLASNYANQQQGNLFYNSGDYANANIPGLQYLDVNSILQYFTDNNSYGQLSGMVSRYQLHGMRLPTNLPGLTLSPGSPCPTNSNCALYSLTGQEFALPSTVAVGFSIQLINNSLSWLQFDGKTMKDEGGNTLNVVLKADDITQITTLLNYAQTTGIQPDVLELAPMQPFNLQPVQYTFQTTTQWQTSGALNLPYGSSDGQSTLSPLIWQFPSGLLNQLALPKESGSQFSIQIGQYDAAKGVMDYWPSSYYGWSTMVDIEIKLLNTDSIAPVNAYSYELLGAGEAGATILQRLLLALNPKSGNNNLDKIIDIQWLYEGPDGVLSVGMEHMKSFIVQANLSTETNPDTTTLMAARAVAAPEPTTGILNSTYDFIRLLWECSITRSGGYYLMYNETESNTGFPSSVFGKGDNATVRLLVTYSSQYNNKPTNYMNCAVTADKIDANSCVVYAQSEMQKGLTTYANGPVDTVDTITARFNILPAELVELNKKVVLNTTANATDPALYPIPVISFKGLVCEVGTTGPGNTLTSIAAYYNVNATLIQQLNPGITNWTNLPLWQLVLLPEVKYTVSTTGKAGNTFEKIAAYYFIDMATLAWAAKDVINLFITSSPLTIDDQILHKVAAVPQGTAGFDLNRTNPNPDPSKQPTKPTDAGYAEVYLNNMYNLLSYQVVANTWFNESIVGLPAGPAKPQSQDDILGKTDTPTDDDAIWYYNQVVPIAKFAKSNSFMTYPAGYPQEADNPYRGIGHQVQVHFDWVDYYGNVTVTPFSNPQLDPTTPINNPPIQTGYVDELKGLGKWPSVEQSYVFDLNASSQPELKLEFNFNTQRYTELPDVPADQQQDWRQNAANDLIVYTSVYYQLTQLNSVNGNNTLTITLSTSLTPGKDVVLGASQFNQLLQFVKDIYTYLSARSNGNAATAPTMQPLVTAINTADIDTRSILQLTVNLDFYRDLQYVNTDFKDSALVTRALTQVKPKTMTTIPAEGSTPQYSLNEFATLFEAAFLSPGNYELKIAIGTNATLAGSANNQAVYVVRMGLQPGQGLYWNVTQAGMYELTTESISQLTGAGVPADITAALTALVGTVYNTRDLFDAALQTKLTAAQFTQYRITIYTYSLLNPVFYAPKPLATSLVSKNNVPICSYVTGKGLDCSKGDVKNFTGIDMDTWGAQSLNAIDVFLSADYAIPAFLVDQLKSADEKAWLAQEDIDATTYLQAITDAKTTLAAAIAAEVEPILTAPYVSTATGDNTSLGNAKEKFEQQLLNQLGNAYTVNALIQFEVTAESDFTPTGNYKTAPRLYGTPVINTPADGDAKEYSISTSKIQLNDKDAVSTDSYLTFSFTTKNAKEFTSVALDMTYVITHVECDVSEVPGINGYQGSNWLTFIIPADVASTAPSADANKAALQQSLGTVDIPVVLRNYPTPPTLTTQTGEPVPVEGDTTNIRLAKASEWDFVYTYTEDQAAQDKIFSDIEFNMVPNATAKRTAAPMRDLFSDLAQFVTVWPQVLDDFNRYLKAITAQSDATDINLNNAYYALQTMVTLSNNLSIAWSQYNGLMMTSPNAGGTARTYDFIIQQTDDNDRLLVTIIPSDEIPPADALLYLGSKVVEGVDLPQMPYVSIDGYNKVNATDKNGTIIPNAYWYQIQGGTTYLSWEDSFKIPSRSVNVDSLNVLQFQYAWAGLSVIRNEDLVPYNPTVSDFIYRTPLVRFTNKLIPLLNNDTLIDIAKINNEAGQNLPLAQQLANFLSTFFTYDELAEQLVKLNVSWNYSLLNGGNSPLPAVQLPVLLAAPFTFEIPSDYQLPAGGCSSTFSESDPFVCRLANALKTWYGQHKPVTNGAWFQLDIAVFSSLNESKLPLIELSNVLLYYKNITDLS